MNRKTDKQELLDDILSAPPDFRDALLDTTLQQVRRRRRFRQTRNVAGLLIVLAVLGIIIWPKNPKQTSIATAPPAKKAVEQSYTLVITEPLSSTNLIKTQSFRATQFITSNSTVEIVQTTTGNVHLINDEQLLALLAAHPAALIRTGPHSEKLVFANPADQTGFPEN